MSDSEFEWQFILVEQGFNSKEEDKKEKNWCRILLQKRLKAVITGQWADEKKHELLGGGFRFFELTKQVDSPTILQMERKELIEAILSSNLNHTSLSDNTYLIAKNKQNEGIYLIWSNNDEKRESKITEKVYRQCVLEQEENNLTPVYHIYARNTNYQTSTIIFNKIPDKVLIEFGIDPTTDTFVNNKEK
ncbi:MAG: hypothetical protein I3270_00385 [Candidatus Moeniiplasma glomeromycotorum]|nr:hypothetical protein [Candidatus Moeniiplasma glomeromycotorum]MCE8162247.1 hypothetical protein [Candidatus Moeniiplasma glomeromycotorum]MCE8166097.1 hypothetical protein [Candidatus Moeniiplasma glomeromycotorum]MCE8166646.1 hypothetical protein [Candidatus Moeniiplasma glomeromycotorum]